MIRILLRAALAAAILTTAAAAEIRWAADGTVVEVTGIELSGLPEAAAPPEAWLARLAVRAAGDGLPPMLGKWAVEGTTLRFTPRFPFRAGMAYEAQWQPAAGGAVKSRHTMPAAPASTVAEVAHIFPSGKILPENLLKFYLHFSAPMSGGGIYQHIHLHNETGAEVDLPFLEIGEELWDREHRRLTLFIDPGRIKREVKPLEDIGPALVAGKSFTLTIDAAWPDAQGRPMKAAARKTFTVTAPDRTPPDPKSWQINPPASGTRAALGVTFPEPMDYALALRLITLASVPGQASLSDDGRHWTFIPDKAWQAGSHRLLIQPGLEDLAGNRIGRAFEESLPRKESTTPAAISELVFEIR